ncbi:BTAD domain-containing putative transcriptional regulator [Spirillospora sp. CA-294931]|uniref:BTAD domain-containing putative transcriptional regulator n=1 Tax=Spirillospora sp. CA-294931 TaxID=3240042 RepID=UPI003D8A3D10
MPGDLGARVRELRERAGLTQRELADRAGVSPRAVRYIEGGTVRNPREDTVRRLAEVLGAGVHADEAAPVRIEVLGPLTVRRGATALEIGPPRRRGLLGLLAVQAGRPVGTDEIVDVLWDGRPPATHASQLHSHIARLRRLLRDGPGPAPVIERAAAGYVLRADDAQLDLAEFDTRVESGPRVEELEAALRLWRGPVLEGMPGPLRAHPAVVAAGRRRVAAAVAYADLALDLCLHSRAVTLLQPVSDLEPLHEGLQARLMLALAGAGRQAAALRLYETLRRRLVDELGVEPGDAVRDAHVRVLRQEVAAEGPSGPVPAQLPRDIAGFCGRGAALAELDAAASAVEAVVITGAPGIGKSALAVRWAHGARERFPDGQLFADLRGHSPRPPASAAETLSGFLAALGVSAARIPSGEEAAATLFRTLLAERRMLVILDDAAEAGQVRALLPGGRGCLVVVTSRDRLAGLVAREGARRVALEPPPPDDARDLLAHVAGADRVAAEPEAAARLVARCGRLPLALRIAGERAASPHVPLAGLADEIDDEHDRLDLLSADGDACTAVRTVFAWSYRALPGPAALMFRRLGLNPGSDLSLPAAAALAGTTVGRVRGPLATLTSRHLVEEHRPGRYRLHELLRLYARERAVAEDPAGDRASAVRRLLAWYHGAVDAAQRVMVPHGAQIPVEAGDVGPRPVFVEPGQALRWCESERANLVAGALAAAESDDDALAWKLPLSLWGLFYLKGHHADWIATHRAALAAARRRGDTEGEAWVLTSLAFAFRAASRPSDARVLMSEAIALWRRRGHCYGEAVALSGLSDLEREAGDDAAALEHGERALARFTEAGSLWGEGIALTSTGLAHRRLGRPSVALDRYRRALAAFYEVGDRFGAGETLAALGEIQVELGRTDRGLRLYERALEASRASGNRPVQGQVLAALGDLLAETGREAEAESARREALPLLDAAGDPRAATVRAELSLSEEERTLS